MKSRFALLTLFLLAALTSPGLQAASWTTDYEDALATAKKKNRPILLNFTGSDWCGWCMKLDKDVFSQKEFDDFASANMILLKVDFPNNRSNMPARVQSQNADLKTKFQITGFPTLVIINGDGVEMGRSRGMNQSYGVTGYVDYFKRTMENRGYKISDGVEVVRAADFRIWTDSSGKTLKARLVEANKDGVVLADMSGKQYELPYRKLASKDETYARGKIDD